LTIHKKTLYNPFTHALVLGSSPFSGFMEELEVFRIHLPKYSLRSDLGQLEELITSIGEKGLLEPIVVKPVRDGFEVVAGCRRLEACKRLCGGRYHAMS
ncbi:MAG: ParB/RepB/Spo0J family partition protein, partial [Candidatus Bathyarchaeia archaeon]